MQGTIHWVADCNAVDVTLNLYDNLFTVDEPLSDENKDHWLDFLNPNSLVVVKVRTAVLHGKCWDRSAPSSLYSRLTHGLISCIVG